MKPVERILFIVNAFENDAPTTVTITLARGMAARGTSVCLAAWARGGSRIRELSDEGMQVVHLGGNTIARYRNLRMLIAKFNPDVVHTSLARPTLSYGVLRPLLPRTPVWIAADHGAHEWHERGRLVGCLMSVMMPWALNRSNMVVTVSEASRFDLVNAGVNGEQVRVVPNGIDVNRFLARSQDYRSWLVQRHFGSAENDGILFGSAGNLRWIKGYDILLQAFAGVVKSLPQSRLIIWGTGEDSDRLFRLRAELNLDNHVSLAGWTEELEQSLSSLDIYVQPSRSESFGMAVAEAMASGIPVVASAVGGLKTLVTDGVTGLHFTEGNAAQLTDKLLLLARDEALRGSLGTAGQELVRQHFTVQQMVDRMSAIYNEVRGRMS